jgi:serine/threonine protein kinase
MIPTLLNHRYRLVTAIGNGGFGATFLAEDTYMPSARRCVIKQLNFLAPNPQLMQIIKNKFQQEAAILEKLGDKSTQIPKLYAYFSEKDRFYLVQELIPGLTLNQKVGQEGVLSESAVKQIVRDILPVLNYVHASRIIHRDIKPSNIILRQSDGKPVLIDFGIAKERIGTGMNTDDEETISIVVGTRGFMPPEQAIGKPVYASDIYSLGLTAIYMLTGKTPQQIETNPQTGEMNWRSYAAGTSVQLAAVLDKATRSGAGDRYQTATEMLDALLSEDPNWQHIPVISPFSPTETLPPVQIPQAPETEPIPQASNSQAAPEIRTISPQEYRHRQILLNKVKNYWIKGVLETSLHGRVIIELGLEKRLDAVDRPWGIVWEMPDQPRQNLSPNTKVIQLFNQLGAGRTLLILGDPGAGKTTTLLELARDLISTAEQDISQAIPVVFNLSSWLSERGTFADWLVQELKTKYQVSKEIGKDWIKNQQLLLMLDGLDEVSAERRDSCVKAINQFIQEYGQTEIVICSRIFEYEALSQRLRLQGAICLQPLTLDQVNIYLSSISSGLTAIKGILQEDTTMQELARSPLMLSIMALAYQGMSIEELAQLRSIEEYRQHLFNAYIERMFNRRGASEPYPKEKAKRWLIWLAQKLVQRSQTVFLIERLQPDWLDNNRQKWLYSILFGLMAGLSCGLAGGFNIAVIGGLYTGMLATLILFLSSGLFATLIVGLIYSHIHTVGSLKWSSLKARDNLILGIRVGLFFGLIFGISVGLISGIISENFYDLVDGLINGLSSGLGVGLIFILLRGLTGPHIETRTVPNQGIWQAAKMAIIFGILGAIVLGILAQAVGLPIIFGVNMGLLFGVFLVGEAAIKHFTLRVVLYFKGFIPWNYARFLDYATERIFMQKVGGGYIFIHRLLLEYFAQMKLDGDN